MLEIKAHVKYKGQDFQFHILEVNTKLPENDYHNRYKYYKSDGTLIKFNAGYQSLYQTIIRNVESIIGNDAEQSMPDANFNAGAIVNRLRSIDKSLDKNKELQANGFEYPVQGTRKSIQEINGMRLD